MRILIIILLLTACASNLTEEEREERDFQREYRYAETYNDWVLCQQAASHLGRIWVTYDASYRRFKKKPTRMQMKQEMSINGCRIRRD